MAFDWSNYNPRYAAYCADIGYANPDEHKATEGSWAEFMCWIQEAWRAFGAPVGKRITRQAEFDAWLPSFASKSHPARQSVEGVNKSVCVLHSSKSLLFVQISKGK